MQPLAPQTEEVIDSFIFSVEKKCKHHLPVPLHLRSSHHGSASSGTELRNRNTPVTPSGSENSEKRGGSPLGRSGSPTTAATGTTTFSSQQPQHGGGGLTPEQRQAIAVAEAKAVCRKKCPDLERSEKRYDSVDSHCNAVVTDLQSLADRVGHLASVADSVRRHSEKLSHGASSLMTQKAQMQRMANALEEVLKRFHSVDDLSKEVQHPMLSPSSARFPALLSDIEDAMTYLEENCGSYKSYATYHNKITWAYQKAMMALRDAATQRLGECVTQVYKWRGYLGFFERSANCPAAHMFLQPPQVGGAAATGSGSKPPMIPQRGATTTSWTTAAGLDASDRDADGEATATAASSIDPSQLGLVIAAINDKFSAALESCMPMLRLLESKSATLSANSNASSFIHHNDQHRGQQQQQPQQAMRDSSYLSYVLGAYGSARESIIVPLLKDFVSERCNNDTLTQQQSCAVVAEKDDGTEKAEQPTTLPAAVAVAASALRSSIAYIIAHFFDAVKEEWLMFDRTWLLEKDSKLTKETFDAIVSSLREVVYNDFRAKLLHVDEIEELCLIAECFRHVIATSGGSGGEGNTASYSVSPTSSSSVSLARFGADVAHQSAMELVRRIFQDTQERIVFRTSIYIRSHLYNVYLIGLEELLPSLLPAKSQDADDTATTTAAAAETMNGDQEQQEQHEQQQHSNNNHPRVWFDKLTQCTDLLDVLYPVMERGVFSVFAEECVHLTVTTLHRATHTIQAAVTSKECPDLFSSVPTLNSFDKYLRPQEQKNATKARQLVENEISVFYSLLFFVSHLLRLREAIARYDCTLSSVERSIDLSSLVKKKLEIIEKSRESRQDVEAELKASCELLIQRMVGFIATGVKHTVAAFKTEKTSSTSSASSSSATISLQSVTPEELKAQVGQCRSFALDCIGDMSGALKQFIAHSATCAVLMHPVRGRAAEMIVSAFADALGMFAESEADEGEAAKEHRKVLGTVLEEEAQKLIK